MVGISHAVFAGRAPSPAALPILLRQQRISLCHCYSTSSLYSFPHLKRRLPRSVRAGARSPHPHNPYMDLPRLTFADQNNTDTPEEREEEEAPKGLRFGLRKLRILSSVASDRAEMHSALAEQRDSWNKLLLSSCNSFSVSSLFLSAFALFALSSSSSSSSPELSFFLGCSTFSHAATSAVALIMHKLQPSQLAEEQRIAARLFRHLSDDLDASMTWLADEDDDCAASLHAEKTYMEILGIDGAYPLPLFPGMLPRFPESVEPAAWWPQVEGQTENVDGDPILDEDLKEVARVLRSRDIPEYLRLAGRVLAANKVFSSAAWVLPAAAAMANMVAMTSVQSDGLEWTRMFVVGMGMACGCVGKMGAVMSHGGQMGMAFEIYRSCAGFYKRILLGVLSSAKKSKDEDEKGEGEEQKEGEKELLRWQVALSLGRKHGFPMIALPSEHPSASDSEFAGKLF